MGRPGIRVPVVPSSLFRRVTRYPVSGALDPRENRLNEVTAAILSEVDGLAAVFVGRLLAPRDDPTSATREARLARLGALARKLDVARVDVNMQVATAHGAFIDLEVLLRPVIGSPQRGLLVWVEVKHGADPHGDQLDVYLRDIELRPVGEEVDRVVVLLAPRGWSNVREQLRE